VLARIRMPADNEEQGRPIAHCTLDGSLSSVWPRILAVYDGRHDYPICTAPSSAAALAPELAPARSRAVHAVDLRRVLAVTGLRRRLLATLTVQRLAELSLHVVVSSGGLRFRGHAHLLV
jgi:hypothetical protein